MARNKELNQKMKDERREQILAGAMKLFAARGLAATKISDIAEAVGISQGLLYHYFRSKEEIYTELVKNAFDKINAACYELEKLPMPPHEKIKFAIEKLLQNLEESESNSRHYLFVSQASSSESTPVEAREYIKNNNMIPYKVIARIMKKGQEAGTIIKHDPKELALVFWTSITGLALYRAVHGAKFKAPDAGLLVGRFLINHDKT
ncbi:MAG: TetR/AcrR family transcriptional regulator [Candidatus Zixiibacteriota bacterium]